MRGMEWNRPQKLRTGRHRNEYASRVLCCCPRVFFSLIGDGEARAARGRWLVWFAASFNSARVHIRTGQNYAPPGHRAGSAYVRTVPPHQASSNRGVYLDAFDAYIIQAGPAMFLFLPPVCLLDTQPERARGISATGPPLVGLPSGSTSTAPPLTVSPLIFTVVGDLTIGVGRRGRVAALDHVLPWYWSSFFSF
jgi:hypothetical protein